MIFILNEDKTQMAYLILITGLIAISAQLPIFSYKQDDAYVTNYTAIFHSDLVLEETYNYRINEPGKHFLYRYWKIYLSTLPLNKSHIQILSLNAPNESVGYIKDHRGQVTLYNNAENDVLQSIENYAYNNEAGAYSRDGYLPGEYTVKYWFKIVPPLEMDDNFIHLNMMLADTHAHYENVKIMIEDNGQIDSVFMHPPTLKEHKERNMRVFTGEIFEDELLEFEILLDRSYEKQIIGQYRRVEGIEFMTRSANSLIKDEYFVASLVLWVEKLSGFLMPLVFLFLWNRYGKEKNITVPMFLSTTPVKVRKPWIVNLVFKRSVSDFDEDALYATLIDLHIRNKIKIEQSEGLSIRIYSDTGLDSYEAEVMNFLKGASVNNVVTRENMERMVEEAKTNPSTRGRVIDLKYGYNRLSEGTNHKVSSEFTMNGRSRLIKPGLYAIALVIIAFSGFLLSNHTEGIFLRTLGYSLIPITQVTTALLFPTTLFGYWKDGYYREKLQWEAFKRHLTDYSRIEEYGTEDLNMWGSWLVYGTALGVGKQVSETLKKIKVPIDIPTDFPEYRVLFTPIIRYSYITKSSGVANSRGFSTSSSRSGGGFGGGRGFGGGGGGVR
jgi:uncharacterized membrane protein